MRIATFIAIGLIATAASAATPDTVILDIKNMTCATCPITVKLALEKVPGVSDVKVDFAHKSATVHLDPQKASTVALTKATADAGFPSTVRK